MNPLPLATGNKIYLDDLRWATIGNGWMWIEADTPHLERNQTILRIEVKQKVKVDLIGLETLDYDLKHYYASVDELPNWVQEKLALLMLTSAKPPTKDVDGVGRKISENIFWVYPPEEMLR